MSCVHSKSIFACSNPQIKLDVIKLDSCLGRGRLRKFSRRRLLLSNLETVIMWQAVLCILLQLKSDYQKMPGLKLLIQELSGICALQVSIRIQSLLYDVQNLAPDKFKFVPAQQNDKTKVRACYLWVCFIPCTSDWLSVLSFWLLRHLQKEY